MLLQVGLLGLRPHNRIVLTYDRSTILNAKEFRNFFSEEELQHIIPGSGGLNFDFFDLHSVTMHAQQDIFACIDNELMIAGHKYPLLHRSEKILRLGKLQLLLSVNQR